MVTATMDRIDPTMGILPDIAKTTLGRQSLTSTASARLDDFLADPNADTLQAFVQSASAAEIARGATPMTAAFGPIAALEQMGRQSPEAARAAQELLALTGGRIEAETEGAITQAQIEQSYGSRQYLNRYGEMVSTTTGFGAAQGLVRAEDAVETALSIGSRMDPLERVKIIEGRMGLVMDELQNTMAYKQAGSIEEQNKLIDEYLLQNDANLVNQISLLTKIEANTAQAPTVIVNGSVVSGGENSDRASTSGNTDFYGNFNISSNTSAIVNSGESSKYTVESSPFYYNPS